MTTPETLGTPWFIMWKKIYYNNFPRLQLINIYVYISVKCMIYHFLHRTLHKVKNTHCFSLCNKAWISWSRKRSLKQQLIQPINGVVSSIMIRLCVCVLYINIYICIFTYTYIYIYGKENKKSQHLEILEAPLTVKIGRFI